LIARRIAMHTIEVWVILVVLKSFFSVYAINLDWEKTIFVVSNKTGNEKYALSLLGVKKL